MEHYSFNKLFLNDSEEKLFESILKDLEERIKVNLNALAESDTAEYDLTKIYKANWAAIWNDQKMVLIGTPLAIVMKNDKYALVVDLTLKKIILQPKYIYRLEDLTVTDITIVKE